MTKLRSKPAHPSEEGDATRDKLLEAAAEAFADRGFNATTVRQIVTRAGANVATVNYYFRDKLGLYSEVLRRSMQAADIQNIHRSASQIAQPEQALRQFIRFMLHRMLYTEQGVFHLRIMALELAHPTPGLPQVVEDMIRPNYDFLRGLVGTIVGLSPNHEITRLCTHSVIGQVTHYVHARPVLELLWPDLSFQPDHLDRIADHIAEFTLAALRGLVSRRPA